MHKPIQIKNLALSFPHKSCFENFNAQINYGDRIAIIGRNGSGKSTLLKMLYGIIKIDSGIVQLPTNVICGYVAQVIEEFPECSGGQRVMKTLTKALHTAPNILLLDEPTNHLDKELRKDLMRMLTNYKGTLIMVSHDMELLYHRADTLWHIDNNKVHVFSGKYTNYLQALEEKRASIELELHDLKHQKEGAHQALMKEQARAAKSKMKGKKNIEQRKWPTVVSHTKASRAAETSGHKKAAISHYKQELLQQLADFSHPENILPKFSLISADKSKKILVSVSSGTVRHIANSSILENINFSMSSHDRIAISGANGSGKSTFIKAILSDPTIIKQGEWHAPKKESIGYLDQHYCNLNPNKTVLESIIEIAPQWPLAEVRNQLSHFLFRKNEEVNSFVYQLSGGEKARLSLAKIAVCTPLLLILDEVTNNLDIETRSHIINVLKAYPGAILIISHDEDFLNKIDIKNFYQIEDSTIKIL